MKCRLSKLFLFLLTGAIINVAVAAACARWSPLRSAAIAANAEPMRLVTGDQKSWWTRYAPSSIPSKPIVTSAVSCFGLDTVSIVSDRYGQMVVETDDQQRVTKLYSLGTPSPVISDFALIVDSGWPCRSLRGGRFIAGNGQRNQARLGASLTIAPASGSETLVNAIRMDRQTSNGIEYRMLPTGILPLGAAINSIVFASFLMVAAILPRGVRKRIRIARHRCPACAYPVGNSPTCTECGGPVKSPRLQTEVSQGG